MMTELTQVQRNIFVLELVKACLNYSKDTKKSFDEILNEDIFPDVANESYSQMVCSTIKELNEQGYISGTVELSFESEFDAETLEETDSDIIDASSSIFDNIEITFKGEAYIGVENFKAAGKDFYNNIKPVIKAVALSTVQACVELAISVGLKSAGTI